MADLLLRDTDRSELVAEIAAKVVTVLGPVLLEAREPMLVDGDRMAELASVSRPTIDRLRADGLIPSVMVASRRLYQPDAVIQALVTANQKGPTIKDDRSGELTTHLSRIATNGVMQ